MKSNVLTKFAVSAALFTASFVAAPLVHAHDHDRGDAMPMAAADDQTAWLAKAKAAYPLDTCVVSGDKLEGGEMGDPVDFVYKQDGKPDRLVRFCCKNCIKDFKKDPAKFLKKIDDAAAAKGDHMGHM